MSASPNTDKSNLLVFIVSSLWLLYVYPEVMKKVIILTATQQITMSTTYAGVLIKTTPTTDHGMAEQLKENATARQNSQLRKFRKYVVTQDRKMILPALMVFLRRLSVAFSCEQEEDGNTSPAIPALDVRPALALPILAHSTPSTHRAISHWLRSTPPHLRRTGRWWSSRR